ncbi:DUF2383 domain-containing protein [Methylomonas sp. AM2-LC]|uniref:DUF2383 domain-containing protein n=1 Tax=Methylomonas sp. AM2-LC TaxID=3153301 RepID=UPI0032668189
MHQIDTINKLLKDELSATETYQQAIDKLKDDVGLGNAETLMPVFEGHKLAASSLEEEIRTLGGIPAENSGAWGTWAKIVQGGVNLFGKTAALKILQEGEKNGTEDYEKILLDHELPAAVRTLIETKLLPAQQSHLNTLNELLDTAAA